MDKVSLEALQKLLTNEFWLSLGVGTLRILAIILLALIASKAAGKAVQIFRNRVRTSLERRGDPSIEESEKRVDTLSGVVKFTLGVTIWSLAAVMSLQEVGFDIGPLLAGAGVIGLAIGFGAQNLVRDIIGGLFLLFEDQIRVGDVAELNGTGGLVEEVNLRTVVLRDLEGVVHVFPNGAITSLSNRTRDFSCYVFDVGVAYKEDTDRVIEVMEEVSSEVMKDEEFGSQILEPLEVFGVDRFADSAVVIKARIKTKPIKQWSVGRELNRRFKQRFDDEGIEIPFPHRTIYHGDKSSGDIVSEEKLRRLVREEIDTTLRGDRKASACITDG